MHREKIEIEKNELIKEIEKISDFNIIHSIVNPLDREFFQMGMKLILTLITDKEGIEKTDEEKVINLKLEDILIKNKYIGFIVLKSEYKR